MTTCVLALSQVVKPFKHLQWDIHKREMIKLCLIEHFLAVPKHGQ